MIVWLIILCIISLIGVKFSRFNDNYLSKDSTNAIKGVFAVIILFSHMKGYIQLSSEFYDVAYAKVLSFIGQMMVAPFLFYSGYGIMESIKRNPNYHHKFLSHRVLKTLIHFDLAVLLFIIVQTPLGKVYPAYKYLTCWFAWESIGNSNWFVFDILALYVIAYFGMIVKQCWHGNNQRFMFLWGGVTVLFGTGLLFVFLFFAKRGQSWWVDTLFTFPLGLLYSRYKSIIDDKMHNTTIYWTSLIVLLTVFVVWHHRFGVDVLGVSSVLFTLILVILTMKIELGNNILAWLGTNAFAIYILQRLPMNVLKIFELNNNTVLFSVFCVAVVLIIAWSFTKLLKILDNFLFASK